MITGPRQSPADLFAAALREHRQGALEPAERLYRETLKADPEHVGALHNLGLIRSRQERNDEAAALIRRAIALAPGSAEMHNNLGTVLQAQHRFDDAVGQFERALALAPDLAVAQVNLGHALLALRRPEEAAARFEAALRLAPGAAEAQHGLGNAFQALGRHDRAIACYEAVLALQPGHADAHNNYANALCALGRLEEAVAHYRRAIALDGDFIDAHYNLGGVLLQLDRPEEAVAAYEAAAALSPDHMAVQVNLGNALQRLGRHREALGCYERALALQPALAVAHNNLAASLQALDRHEEALARYDAALVLRPGDASTFANKGNVLREIGEIEAARDAFCAAIERAPDNAEFYLALAQVKRFSPEDPHLLALTALADNAGRMAPPQRQALHFALGKALADIADHERAFAHLLAGNALKRQEVAYDEAPTLALLERIRTAFPRDRMARPRDRGEASTVPLFVIGMPRSGTTLVEQILASHPRVFGGGERSDFGDALADFAGDDAAPEATAHLDDAALHRLGDKYLARLRALAPDADRITDKMPLNFLHAGLIHLALPGARIIHVRRDPIDTCVSCFATLFAEGHGYAYELGELGRYYRAYDALMRHWQSVLPPEAMIEVQYEALVADVAAESRRLIAQCGLDWDDRCLDFHHTRRAVRTASAAQVRRPIYLSSVGRWRVYRRELAPLLEALGPELAAS